jgi:hypothetical protein
VIFFHFYHKRLTMEIEPHTGTFKFLESMITVKDRVISSQFYLRNYNKERNRESLRSFSILSTGTATTMPPSNALSFLGRCTAFSVFLTHLKAQSFPLLPTGLNYVTTVTQHTSSISLLNPCQTQLSHAPSGTQLVVWSHLSTTTPHLISHGSPFELRVKVTNDGLQMTW